MCRERHPHQMQLHSNNITLQKSLIKIPTKHFYFPVNSLSDARFRYFPYLKPSLRWPSKFPLAVQPCPKTCKPDEENEILNPKMNPVTRSAATALSSSSQRPLHYLSTPDCQKSPSKNKFIPRTPNKSKYNCLYIYNCIT